MKIFYTLIFVLVSVALSAQDLAKPSHVIPPPPPPPPPPIKVERKFERLTEWPRFFSEECENLTDDPKKKRICAREKMLEYIYENLRYPIGVEVDSIAETVVVRFTITKNGFIKEAEVVRAESTKYFDEAKRVVESMNGLPNRWIPGYSNKKPVDSRFILPIRFGLKQ